MQCSVIYFRWKSNWIKLCTVEQVEHTCAIISENTQTEKHSPCENIKWGVTEFNSAQHFWSNSQTNSWIANPTPESNYLWKWLRQIIHTRIQLHREFTLGLHLVPNSIWMRKRVFVRWIRITFGAADHAVLMRSMVHLHLIIYVRILRIIIHSKTILLHHTIL